VRWLAGRESCSVVAIEVRIEDNSNQRSGIRKRRADGRG
jgi:hypothetical protein